MYDERVSFETAMLAKAKGFDELSPKVYSVRGSVRVLNYWEGEKEEHFDPTFEGFVRNSNLNDDLHDTVATAPTQALLQRWLRETHNIHIGVWFSVKEQNYNAHAYHGIDLEIESEVVYLGSYEAALEAGLMEALKLIK